MRWRHEVNVNGIWKLIWKKQFKGILKTVHLNLCRIVLRGMINNKSNPILTKTVN